MGESDLSGISDQSLYVTEGVHQANIEVNEEGSEAAAATGVVVGVRTIRRKKQFFADTPFLFMIYDFQNNIPLFAGKVVDPTTPSKCRTRLRGLQWSLKCHWGEVWLTHRVSSLQTLRRARGFSGTSQLLMITTRSARR